MALKHYAGSVPTARAPWRCPTCGAENTGALEEGCSACGAGKDARKVTVTAKPGYEAQAETIRQLAPALDAALAIRIESAFTKWRDANFTEDEPTRTINIARDAFMAAIDWVQAGGLAVPYVTPAAVPEPAPIDLDDPIVRATLAAALSFYIDNQLAYGAVPGQLALADAKALLVSLQPPTEDETPL